jgi:lipoprotein-anchoring transpeptidase ErfK/SrfK
MGFIGSWALLALALGLASYAIAEEVINVRDLRRLDRVAVVDEMIKERTGNKAEALKTAEAARVNQMNALRSQLQSVEQQTIDTPDTSQAIIVSTEENKLWVRRGAQNVFEAVCSTGKGSTLAADGKTFVFDTPIGKLHIISKEENPQWVPPDWHYIEQARQNGLRVVHLKAGETLDARTGQTASSSHDFFSWFRGSTPVLKVKGDTVVVDDGTTQRELPPGQDIVVGQTIVIPPLNTKQRHYDKVLGKYRLELGNGYGIHGTDEPEKLGQSVSHGCVRLGDTDIEALYRIANIGDTVIIY